jgi:hypothetical protein
MSDSRRRYRAIKAGLLQLYPQELTGRAMQRLNVLAMLISGIVGSGSTHLRQVAKKAPTGAKVESRIKQMSRWYQNESNSYELHYLPFIAQLLAHLSGLPLVLTIDGSEVGRGCMTLMVSLIYQKRAIPLVWSVIDRPKGHLSAQQHIALLNQLQPLLPADAEIILLGDGEFDSVELQSYLAQHNWEYVCRTAKDTWVWCEGEWVQLDDLALPDLCVGLEAVGFTEQAYGPVTVVVWWDKAYQSPIFLVSNLTLVGEICHWYRRRMCIETLFSDQKSRGFRLNKSHISTPDRLFRILMAACLAYIWMIYLGVYACRHGYLPLLHRTDRCDLSLFQLGLDLLDHFLNADLPIQVDFRLPPEFLFIESVR